jgi:hypothetical protein
MLPPIILSLMTPFRSFFTASVWEHVLVLAPGKHTVSTALRIMGLGAARDFATWSFRQDQRFALALGDGLGSRPMDAATVGPCPS